MPGRGMSTSPGAGSPFFLRLFSHLPSWDISPKPFQVEEIPPLRDEDVHDYVTVIHEDPLACGIPLHVAGEYLLLFQRLFDGVGDRLGLAPLQPVADEEKIGERTGALHVEGDRIGGLLLERGLMNEL